ncbi:MAG: hypothetical protein KF906_08225 [Actinobacteria bacterium]|nr:hypothetical protein [Actinomycetota bacterium]
MVMNWGIRPADLIDGDDDRQRVRDEHEPTATKDRPMSAPTGPIDVATNRAPGRPPR